MTSPVVTKISEAKGLVEALALIAGEAPSLHGALKLNAGKVKGAVTFSHGRLTGAYVHSTGERGRSALETLMKLDILGVRYAQFDQSLISPGERLDIEIGKFIENFAKPVSGNSEPRPSARSIDDLDEHSCETIEVRFDRSELMELLNERPDLSAADGLNETQSPVSAPVEQEPPAAPAFEAEQIAAGVAVAAPQNEVEIERISPPPAAPVEHLTPVMPDDAPPEGVQSPRLYNAVEQRSVTEEIRFDREEFMEFLGETPEWSPTPGANQPDEQQQPIAAAPEQSAPQPPVTAAAAQPANAADGGAVKVDMEGFDGSEASAFVGDGEWDSRPDTPQFAPPTLSGNQIQSGLEPAPQQPPQQAPQQAPVGAASAPPAQQMQPPAQQMQPPAQQMQPPAQQMQPPTQQTQAPTQQMQPPTQQMQAPAQQMQPPTQQMQAPPQQMQPPAQQQFPQPPQQQQPLPQSPSAQQFQPQSAQPAAPYVHPSLGPQEPRAEEVSDTKYDALIKQWSAEEDRAEFAAHKGVFAEDQPSLSDHQKRMLEEYGEHLRDKEGFQERHEFFDKDDTAEVVARRQQELLKEARFDDKSFHHVDKTIEENIPSLTDDQKRLLEMLAAEGADKEMFEEVTGILAESGLNLTPDQMRDLGDVLLQRSREEQQTEFVLRSDALKVPQQTEFKEFVEMEDEWGPQAVEELEAIPTPQILDIDRAPLIPFAEDDEWEDEDEEEEEPDGLMGKVRHAMGFRRSFESEWVERRRFPIAKVMGITTLSLLLIGVFTIPNMIKATVGGRSVQQLAAEQLRLTVQDEISDQVPNTAHEDFNVEVSSGDNGVAVGNLGKGEAGEGGALGNDPLAFARSLVIQGRAKEAVAYYEAYVNRNPDSIPARLELIQCLLSTKQKPKARHLCIATLKRKLTDGEIAAVWALMRQCLTD